MDEVDGGQHLDERNMQKDLERTRILKSFGLEVLRFTNDEIDKDFFEVCMKIKQKIESPLTTGLEQ